MVEFLLHPCLDFLHLPLDVCHLGCIDLHLELGMKFQCRMVDLVIDLALADTHPKWTCSSMRYMEPPPHLVNQDQLSLLESCLFHQTQHHKKLCWSLIFDSFRVSKTRNTISSGSMFILSP
jgi:hypothetical protein